MKNLIPFPFIFFLFYLESCQKNYPIDPIQKPKCGSDVITKFPLGDSLTTLYETNRDDYHNRIVFKDSLGKERYCWLRTSQLIRSSLRGTKQSLRFSRLPINE